MLLSKALESSKAKTRYAVQLAYDMREDGTDVVIGAHPRLAELAVQEILVGRCALWLPRVVALHSLLPQPCCIIWSFSTAHASSLAKATWKQTESVRLTWRLDGPNA